MGLFSLPVTLLFDANEGLVHSHGACNKYCVTAYRKLL